MIAHFTNKIAINDEKIRVDYNNTNFESNISSFEKSFKKQTSEIQVNNKFEFAGPKNKKTITNDFEINMFKNFENIKFFNENQIKVETESKFNNKSEFLSNFSLEEQKESNALLPKIAFEKLGSHKKTNTLQKKFEMHQQQKLKKEIKICEKEKDINIKVKECDELIMDLKNKKLKISEKKMEQIFDFEQSHKDLFNFEDTTIYTNAKIGKESEEKQIGYVDPGSQQHYYQHKLKKSDKNETGVKVMVFDARTENEEFKSKESVDKIGEQAESNIKSDRSLNNLTKYIDLEGFEKTSVINQLDTLLLETVQKPTKLILENN